MAIPKNVRDKLLVEARHRCAICAEKCFEIHHIDGDRTNNHILNLVALSIQDHYDVHNIHWRQPTHLSTCRRQDTCQAAQAAGVNAPFVPALRRVRYRR